MTADEPTFSIFPTVMIAPLHIPDYSQLPYLKATGDMIMNLRQFGGTTSQKFLIKESDLQ